MKYFLPIIFSALVFTGCGTISGSTAGTEETGSDAAAPSVKIIKYKLPVVLKETRKYHTGDVDIYTTYEYEKGTEILLSSTTFDSDDEILEYVKTEKNEKTVKYMYFDKSSKPVKTRVTGADNNGNITESLLIDSRGKQISRSEYEYDNSEKVKWSIYDSNNTLLAYNTYLYDENGNNTKINSFSPTGGLEEYFINSYDESGNIISTEHFNSSGKKLDSSVSKYKNDMIIEKNFYKGEKTLIRKISYDYNNNYTIQTGTVFTAGGDIIEIIEKEYFFIEKEKEILQ